MSADPRLDSQVAGLKVEVSAVLRELDQARADLGREIGHLRRSLTEAIDRNTEQVLRTNGKVRDHELRFAQMEARAEERERLALERDREAAAQRARIERRDRWLIVFASGTFVTVLGLAVRLLSGG